MAKKNQPRQTPEPEGGKKYHARNATEAHPLIEPHGRAAEWISGSTSRWRQTRENSCDPDSEEERGNDSWGYGKRAGGGSEGRQGNRVGGRISSGAKEISFPRPGWTTMASGAKAGV
ncbi:hypothetical protein ACJRO7_000663 [Eucalyptus globulus]|uniref:Uncharacterized protein n=1 Tax=Eucalyptus globulus TaxID=34317 RepID=A0ABD3LND1_EUCGL